MALEMKPTCERCQSALPANGNAVICTYECTFCSTCAAELKSICPNCNGELVRRPRPVAGKR